MKITVRVPCCACECWHVMSSCTWLYNGDMQQVRDGRCYLVAAHHHLDSLRCLLGYLLTDPMTGLGCSNHVVVLTMLPTQLSVTMVCLSRRPFCHCDGACVCYFLDFVADAAKPHWWLQGRLWRCIRRQALCIGGWCMCKFDKCCRAALRRCGPPDAAWCSWGEEISGIVWCAARKQHHSCAGANCSGCTLSVT